MTTEQNALEVSVVPADIVRFDDLPTLHGPRPEGQPLRPRDERRTFNRRRFIERVAGAGMALGLASLTVFPPARAHADGYKILNYCPFSYPGKCSPGCGPSPLRQAACSSNGWHRNTGCFYRLRPNQCSGDYDGWIWRVTGCDNYCGSARTGFRCHDGRTCPDNCGGCYSTICRHFVGCS